MQWIRDYLYVHFFYCVQVKKIWFHSSQQSTHLWVGLPCAIYVSLWMDQLLHTFFYCSLGRLVSSTLFLVFWWDYITAWVNNYKNTLDSNEFNSTLVKCQKTFSESCNSRKINFSCAIYKGWRWSAGPVPVLFVSQTIRAFADLTNWSMRQVSFNVSQLFLFSVAMPKRHCTISRFHSW